MATPPHIPPENPPPDASRGYEHGDLRLKGIIIFVVAMTVCAILIQWGVYALWQNTSTDVSRQDKPVSSLVLRDANGNIQHPLPPGPLLQPFSPDHADLPYQDLLNMRTQNQDILSTYGTAPGNPDDPARARIPIQRAMQLLAQQGIHDRGKP